MVQGLQDRYDCPVRDGCQLMNLPRSSYYYHSQKPDESQLAAHLLKAAGEYPKYGSRRLMHQLGRAPYFDPIGRYRVRRLMRQLRQRKVQISMAAQGEPRENGFAERMMRTIKEEEVDLSDYLDFADAQVQMAHFLDTVYNQKRIHSSLGYLTPSEFEANWTEIHCDQGYP